MKPRIGSQSHAICTSLKHAQFTKTYPTEKERERGRREREREKTRDEKSGINPKLRLTSLESNSVFKELPLMYESGISSWYPSANAKIAGRAAVLSST